MEEEEKDRLSRAFFTLDYSVSADVTLNESVNRTESAEQRRVNNVYSDSITITPLLENL